MKKGIFTRWRTTSIFKYNYVLFNMRFNHLYACFVAVITGIFLLLQKSTKNLLLTKQRCKSQVQISVKVSSPQCMNAFFVLTDTIIYIYMWVWVYAMYVCYDKIVDARKFSSFVFSFFSKR